MKGYWCEECTGFVHIKKKHLGAVVGNIIIFPIIIITFLVGEPWWISAKKLCKKCGTKVKRMKMNKEDHITQGCIK